MDRIVAHLVPGGFLKSVEVLIAVGSINLSVVFQIEGGNRLVGDELLGDF